MVKIGVVVASLLVAAAFTLAGRSSPPAPITKPAPVPVKDAKPDYWKTPSSASPADRAEMLEWFAANDICRGSNVRADSKPCKTRDKDENDLRSRGWCWAYDDYTVFPPDYKWHRCSQKSLPLDQRTVNSDTLTPDDGDAPIDKNFGGRSEVPEMMVTDGTRASSALLDFEAAYDRVIEADGVAAAHLRCGRGDFELYQDIRNSLVDQASRDENLQRIEARMTDEDFRQLRLYERKKSDEVRAQAMDDLGCRSRPARGER